jgi:hypothetical protein
MDKAIDHILLVKLIVTVQEFDDVQELDDVQEFDGLWFSSPGAVLKW